MEGLPCAIRPSVLMFVGFSNSLTLPVLMQTEAQLQKTLYFIS